VQKLVALRPGPKAVALGAAGEVPIESQEVVRFCAVLGIVGGGVVEHGAVAEARGIGRGVAAKGLLVVGLGAGPGGGRKELLREVDGCEQVLTRCGWRRKRIRHDGEDRG